MGVILPGVDGTGFSPSFFVGLGWEKINFCGSGTGEVWEFTPVSPSSVYFIIIYFFYPRNVWFTLSGYWVLWSNKNLCFHSCFWHHRISRALQLCWFCARSWMNEKCDLFKGTKSLLGNIHYLLFCWACVEAVVCLKVVVLLSERLQLYELFLCAQHNCFSSLVLQKDFKWVQPSTSLLQASRHSFISSLWLEILPFFLQLTAITFLGLTLLLYE